MINIQHLSNQANIYAYKCRNYLLNPLGTLNIYTNIFSFGRLVVSGNPRNFKRSHKALLGEHTMEKWKVS